VLEEVGYGGELAVASSRSAAEGARCCATKTNTSDDTTTDDRVPAASTLPPARAAAARSLGRDRESADHILMRRSLALATSFGLAAALVYMAARAFGGIDGAGAFWSLALVTVLGAIGAGVASNQLTGNRRASLGVAAVTVVLTTAWVACIFAFLLVAVYPPGN
jgi:hypothetical protein